MANTKLIKGRMKAAKNISQITKAMQMVSAAKMKKAQDAALLNRNYSEKLFEMTKNLIKNIDKQKDNKNKTLYLVITPSKGLCGSLNTNLARKLLEITKENRENSFFITIGKKGEQVISKISRNMLASFDFGITQPKYELIVPVAKMILSEFQKNKFSRVMVLFADFVNTLVQKPKFLQILPIKKEGEEIEKDLKIDYIFEPNKSSILTYLIPYYVENQIFQLVLEAYASEQSARMIAMKNATDNASEVVRDLTLIYNRARQAQITNEINDIATAQLAN